MEQSRIGILGSKEIHSNVGVAEDSASVNMGQKHEP
jgi:hypothetical protein